MNERKLSRRTIINSSCFRLCDSQEGAGNGQDFPGWLSVMLRKSCGKIFFPIVTDNDCISSLQSGEGSTEATPFLI